MISADAARVATRRAAEAMLDTAIEKAMGRAEDLASVEVAAWVGAGLVETAKSHGLHAYVSERPARLGMKWVNVEWAPDGRAHVERASK